MNQSGGDWTEQKIEMIVSYTKAYLVIMNKYPQFKTIYFDGFAGSGDINKEEANEIEIIKGAAIRILEIDSPKIFDLYYFVELKETNKLSLENLINIKFPDRKRNVVCEDCNVKLTSMANFLNKNLNYRALAFIDPYGMSVDWSSIEKLKNLGIDMWILVPTGIGVNRLLKIDGKISDAWLEKLEKFLGLSREEIKRKFYREQTVNTLFGQETTVEKEKNAIVKIGELYKERLNTIFKFVSDSYAMKNSTNSIMYHFMMATNNPTALKIANDIIKPKYKI